MTPSAPGSGESPSAPTTTSQVWAVVSTVVAPTALVAALLCFYGYTSLAAQFAYFGVPVDALGFSTQDYSLRAPEALLAPGLVLLLAGAGLAWLDGVVRRRLRPSDAAHHSGLLALRWTGAAALACGLVLLLSYAALETWDPYPLVTPALIGGGAGALALAAAWSAHAGQRRSTAVVLLALILVTSMFWATGTVAHWAGTGQAKSLAAELTVLPAVVLDTAEPLLAGDPTVVETLLPASEGQAFRYRYRGLRVLAARDDRLFLVPAQWSSSGSTFVIDLDEARVKFRFVHDPP